MARRTPIKAAILPVGPPPSPAAMLFPYLHKFFPETMIMLKRWAQQRLGILRLLGTGMLGLALLMLGLICWPISSASAQAQAQASKPNNGFIQISGKSFIFKANRPVVREPFALEKFFQYVGSYDYAAFLNTPEISQRLRDVTGPYFERSMNFYKYHHPVQFIDGYFVLQGYTYYATPEIPIILIHSQTGDVCAGLKVHKKRARIFCPGETFSSLPRPLRIFVQRTFHPYIQEEIFAEHVPNEIPRNADYANISFLQERWKQREARLGKIDPWDRIPK